MTGDPGELERRLRANRGKVHRPAFMASVERTVGLRVADGHFLDLEATDRLAAEISAALRATEPIRRWPATERSAVFGYVQRLSRQLDRNHSSCLAFFDHWLELGALRVPSSAVLAASEELWSEGSEPFCLATMDLLDVVYLDYTEPEQAPGEEYELFAWGAFAST